MRELLAWGPTRATARLVKGHFHAKVIWWRGYGAYVGSANLTHKAWFNNVEAGLFLDEEELASSGVGEELDAMFDHLANVSVSVTDEMIAKLEQLARDHQRITEGNATRLDAKFKDLFGHLPDNAGLTVAPPKGHRENRALNAFVVEWNQTLQTMRGLAKDFAALRLRPRWVASDAHPAIHFDQFLQAFYYTRVRGEVGFDEDDDLTSKERVEQFFVKNRTNTADALRDAARWWASLPEDPHGEAEFIRTTAPQMGTLLSRNALAHMDKVAFREAMRNVNAFRMHARQTKNSTLGLPAGHHEDMEARVTHLCDWLWEQRSASGKTVRDVLEFVLCPNRRPARTRDSPRASVSPSARYTAGFLLPHGTNAAERWRFPDVASASHTRRAGPWRGTVRPVLQRVPRVAHLLNLGPGGRVRGNRVLQAVVEVCRDAVPKRDPGDDSVGLGCLVRGHLEGPLEERSALGLRDAIPLAVERCRSDEVASNDLVANQIAARRLEAVRVIGHLSHELAPSWEIERRTHGGPRPNERNEPTLLSCAPNQTLGGRKFRSVRHPTDGFARGDGNGRVVLDRGLLDLRGLLG